MKKALLLMFLSALLISPAAEAQFGSKLKKKIKQAAEKRVEKKVDDGIEKGLDKIEEDAEDAVSGQNPGEPQQEQKTEPADIPSESSTLPAQSGEEKPTLDWARYDFVPGDKIIFEDSPSPEEENGEFPSRWDLVKGQVEIAKFDGEQVIALLDGNPTIIPYIKNAEEDYLPEQFTIEFDIYRPADGNRFFMYLTDRKNQAGQDEQEIEVSHERISAGGLHSVYPGGKDRSTGRWMHIALAFTKGKLKIYMDDTRLINIPHYEENPGGFTLKCYFADAGNDKAWLLKNFRIAEGGVKYYDRALQEGKIVVNGIKFDVDKATLRPESMGPINKIFELMEENPEIRFSVEGHTDSDGSEDHNQELSRQRAAAVVDQLLSMGISSDRLSSKGWGEYQPIGSNDTAEGKATNRRVEFVRI